MVMVVMVAIVRVMVMMMVMVVMVRRRRPVILRKLQLAFRRGTPRPRGIVQLHQIDGIGYRGEQVRIG